MWLIKKTRAEVITILTLQPLTALFLFPRRKKAEMEGERTQRHVSVSQHRPVLGGVLLTLNFFVFYTGQPTRAGADPAVWSAGCAMALTKSADRCA